MLFEIPFLKLTHFLETHFTIMCRKKSFYIIETLITAQKHK